MTSPSLHINKVLSLTLHSVLFHHSDKYVVPVDCQSTLSPMTTLEHPCSTCSLICCRSRDHRQNHLHSHNAPVQAFPKLGGTLPLSKYHSNYCLYPKTKGCTETAHSSYVSVQFQMQHQNLKIYIKIMTQKQADCIQLIKLARICRPVFCRCLPTM